MLGVILIISAIALAALAGIVGLMRFIAKGMRGGAKRGIVLAAAFVAAIVITDAVASYTSIYYVKPPGLLLAVAACVAVVAVLFVTLGRGIQWKPAYVVALVGLGLVSMVLFAITAMALTGLVKPPFPYATRARQIADANGFEVLMPLGEQLQTDSLPIDPLPAPDAGVYLAYERFTLEERKAGSGSAKGPLKERLRKARTEKAAETKIAETTVLGVPALTAEYRITPPEGAHGPAYATKFQRETKLIFELDGVEVRLVSFSTERERNGKFVPFPSLTTSQLLAIAKTLRRPAP